MSPVFTIVMNTLYSVAIFKISMWYCGILNSGGILTDFFSLLIGAIWAK